MIKKIKQLLTTLSISTLLFVPVAAVSVVGAQSSADCLDSVGGGIDECLQSGAVTTDPDGSTEPASDRVDQIVRLVINIFSWIVGIISVIMIIIGGLKYITSGGDSGNITGAKNTILYAIIGLVVVALAQVVVRFVLDKATTTA